LLNLLSDIALGTLQSSERRHSHISKRPNDHNFWAAKGQN